MFAIGLLISSSRFAFADDDYPLPDPPPPPIYKPVGGQTALETLRDLKVAWLKSRIKELEKQIKSFNHKKDDPDENKEALEKAIKKFTEAKNAEQKDIDALSGKNALDPAKDTTASDHARLIKSNVEAWINTLDAQRQAAARAGNGDRMSNIAKEQKALEDALKEAQEKSKKLFE